MIRLKVTDEGIEATVSVKVMCRTSKYDLHVDLGNAGSMIAAGLSSCADNIHNFTEVTVKPDGAMICKNPPVEAAEQQEESE